HDILKDEVLSDAEIHLHPQWLEEGPFLFSHKLVTDRATSYYQITGHVHPAVHVSGRGRQSATLPCFYFGKRYAILPAFGNFTGYATIQPASQDRIFMILGEKVVQMEKNFREYKKLN